ncbi:hypothetical protein MVEG_12444, partial [Podila verticillata NRRL 6337]
RSATARLLYHVNSYDTPSPDCGLLSINLCRIKFRRAMFQRHGSGGYANNAGNILAYGVAGAAAYSNIAPWMVDLSAQTEIPFFALSHDQVLENNLRNTLKQQTTLRRDHIELLNGAPNVLCLSWTAPFGNQLSALSTAINQCLASSAVPLSATNGLDK